MNLREPRKKRYTKYQSKPPFPVCIGKEQEWTVFTAHLSVSGVCIVDPEEMIAIHTMGCFGKGSLSRSFPTFSKRRFGAPPLVRERQWKRRQQWLDEVNKLHSEAFPFVSDEHDISATEKTANDSHINLSFKDSQEPMEIDISMRDHGAEHLDRTVASSSTSFNEITHVDEVILDSTEDEEVCEIVDINRERNDSQSDDILVLNDQDMNQPLQPDEYTISTQSADEQINQINPQEVTVLPDSDSDTENYLKNIKPRIETEGFPVTETLQLTFEETFFLMYGLGCLQLVNYDGKLLSIVDAWNHFNEQDKHFFTKYIVYHYFRSKGWVVKPGLKYGGDFLLYKQGPGFYHASYIVIVETVDPHTLLRNESKSTRKMTWNALMLSNRLAEVTAKEFMIAQVLWPLTISPQSHPPPLEALTEFTVRELLWRRWKANQTDEVDGSEDDDSEDDDSS